MYRRRRNTMEPDTGAHGAEKIFAPGQESRVRDNSASSFAP